MDFSAWLQRQLDRKEWTQAEFAKKVGASTGAVSMWLNGKRLPDPISVDKIADVLGMEVDYVLTVAGHRPEIDPIEDDPIRSELVSRINRIRLTEDRVEALESILDRWIKKDRESGNRIKEQTAGDESRTNDGK